MRDKERESEGENGREKNARRAKSMYCIQNLQSHAYFCCRDFLGVAACFQLPRKICENYACCEHCSDLPNAREKEQVERFRFGI